MKKIITLISVLLICITTFGQFPQNPTQGQTQIKQTNLGAIEAQRGLKAGQFVDTSAANAVLYMKGVAGILIYTTSDNNYWYRSADTTRWVLIATTTSNCAGTQLISGSITWSGSGLVYDATDLDYYILCSRYFANSTTLTLAVADPTYGRIDKFYADNTQNIGVITGTPSANPQEPSVNPLTQIDLGFVYIPAGSTVPAGTTQTVIYNENVEFIGTSDVPSINFAYATNPYIGSLSTYIPSAPNSSYVEWQSNGIDYLFSDAQYLKFWVRLNANFTVDPLSFLDVTFEYTDVTVSQTLSVGNGDYNMDYSLINQWQLVSIPLTGITTYGTEFNEVHFVINSAPTSFQLDYVYLLETATIPPAPVGGTWLLNGNSAINDVIQYIGTRDAKKLNFGTNGQIRAYIDTAGIDLLIDDTTANVMLIDSNGKIRKTYQPTILADAPLYIYTDSNNKRHIADTSATAGGNCGLISGGEVTLIDSTTFNVSAALYCIGNVNYSSLDSVMTLVTPGDTVRIDVIGVDTSGSVFKLTGVEAENPSPPSVDATYQLVLSFVLVSTDSITPYNPQLSWSTGGNSGTNPFINFLGTTDSKGFMIKTNNNRSGYIDKIHFSTSWGIEALNTNAGDNNNAVGYGAGFLNSTGSDNNYLGNAAGYTNTTGIRNTAIGGVSGYANTGGGGNTSIGYRSLQDNQASGLVAVGLEALQLNTEGEYNTAVGYRALKQNTIGTKNTALGHSALESNIDGGDNVAISYRALRFNTTGNGNIGIGLTALYLNTTGSLNTSVGNNSGVTLTTGSNNTFLGANADAATATTDSSGAFGVLASPVSRQMAFSPYFNTMFLDLDSASGTAPSIAGIDKDGNWRKYATPSGGSSQWTDTTAGIYYGNKVAIGGAINPTHTLTIGDSATNQGTVLISVPETDDVFSIYSNAEDEDIIHIDNLSKVIKIGASNYKVGVSTLTPDSNVTVNGGTHLIGGVRASSLPSNQTYSKSLAITSNGTLYTKDTLAVSGVYARLASPTFTGTVNLPATTFNGILSSTFNASFNNLILLGGLYIPKTITAGGTTGAQTINKPTGAVNFAAGATTLVVTNSLVSSTSLVIVQVYGTDVTATTARVTLAAGSFTITLNAAATAETKVGFFVTN